MKLLEPKYALATIYGVCDEFTKNWLGDKSYLDTIIRYVNILNFNFKFNIPEAICQYLRNRLRPKNS